MILCGFKPVRLLSLLCVKNTGTLHTKETTSKIHSLSRTARYRFPTDVANAFNFTSCKFSVSLRSETTRLSKIQSENLRSSWFLQKRLAGHSKWSNIKAIKKTKDEEKSHMYQQIGQQMKVAGKSGGINPANNVRLAQIIEMARSRNMPNASIANVLKQMQSAKDDCKLHTMEIRGPSGCFVLVDVYTANITRTKQLLTPILRKARVVEWSDGASRHFFQHKGLVLVRPKAEQTLEVAMDAAIEAGAEDVTEVPAEEENEANLLQFVCDPMSLTQVRDHLESSGYSIVQADLNHIATQLASLSDEHLDLMGAMFDKLENHVDVVRLYDNIA